SVLVGLWQGFSELERRSRGVAPLVLGGVLGLAPYLTLFAHPTADGAAFVWRPVAGWSDLIAHFLRAEYGPFQLSPQAETALPLPQLGAFFGRVASELMYLPAVLALFGFVRVRGSAATWALRASFLLSGPVFAMLLNIPPYGPGQLFIPRFY